MWVPLWWWLAAAVLTGVLGYEIRLGAHGAAWSWWVFPAVAALLVAVLVSVSRRRIRVTADGELHAGGARLPGSVIGRGASVPPSAKSAAMGRQLDPAAFLVHHSWVRPMVLLVLDDPDDPTPYWLVSTRHPDKLLSALGVADARLAGTPESPAPVAPERSLVISALGAALYPPLRWLMFRLPAETVHGIASGAIRLVGALPGAGRLVGRALTVDDPILRQEALGTVFPAPLGLAAGFDKSAAAVRSWGPMGFGYAEIGTITGQAQPGNPKPRLFRLTADRALINRMGFNNPGADATATRLGKALRSSRGHAVPIGANIGKTKAVELSAAADDYTHSATRLGPLADFVVVNVSSPNTPGLRDLQAVEQLRPILAAVRAATDRPVLVKIAPDLADDDVDAVADLAVETGLAGIVATNTTISRAGLRSSPEQVSKAGDGGLSGPPVADRSLAVLRRLYARVGDDLLLVSAGGIETADDAWERILAGATLLQGYTGFIYGGPLYAKDIHAGLAAKVRGAGFASIAEAVGAGHRTAAG
ncbi:dihydroorotate dehydrogenase [Gordonia araii NBRC 100433]|uniref:Dihydroorotate dehydrogenase (quinone) n=1 Tax=Gordonia araii NBRC 100433 TaxID=1073574 RepID=G7H5K1_9ACTN|nr:dihydroorotate dehydrogenase [Gordonia araii NBRC 100433]